MTGVALNFSLDDLASQTLKALPEQFADSDKMLDEVGAYLDADYILRFRNEEAPDGTQWEQSQRAKDDGGLTLTDERNLADSVTHNVDNGQLEQGTNSIYAAIHHFGGFTGRNHATEIVARELIGIEATQTLAISNIWHTWGQDIVS